MLQLSGVVMTKTRGYQYLSRKRCLTMGLPQREYVLSRLSAPAKGRRGGREDNYLGKARSTDKRSRRCRANPPPKAILERDPEREHGLQLRPRAMMTPAPEGVRPHHVAWENHMVNLPLTIFFKAEANGRRAWSEPVPYYSIRGSGCRTTGKRDHDEWHTPAAFRLLTRWQISNSVSFILPVGWNDAGPRSNGS